MVIASLHRSYHAPVIVPDVQLEFWAKVYRANAPIAARGVSFEQFLASPFTYLAGARSPVTVAVHGQLTDATRSALLRLTECAVAELERSGTNCANGRYVEKLRHHRNRGRSSYRAIQK